MKYLKLFRVLPILVCTGWCCFSVAQPASYWKQDLDFLAEKLPKLHKNLFRTLSQKDFNAQVKQIRESLPGMTDLEVRIALTKLVASVGNAHTWIHAFAGTAMYPIRFCQFPEGIYVTYARAEYRRTIGARLTGVGELSIDEVRKILKPLGRLENDLMEGMDLPSNLISAAVLHGTRILPGENEGTFHFEKDRQAFAVAIRATQPDQQRELLNRPDAASYKTPLYLSKPQTFYWFQYLDQDRALYIQYNSCQEMKSLSFNDFTSQLMAEADSHPVEKVILDLRHNGGGASWIIDPLFKALKERPVLRHKSHFFVLTSLFTFSSGLMNALSMKNMFGAQMVGEPSAQRPNGYGDKRSFRLPNSGLVVDYATKYFSLVSGDPPFVAPDILVQLRASDYFSGSDPVLERVLQIRQ